MYCAAVVILAFVVTAQAQDGGAPNSLESDTTPAMRLGLRGLTSTNSSAQDAPVPKESGFTGAELLDGLQAVKELPLLRMQMEQLDKDVMASTRLDFWKVLGILRASIFGGEVAWLKEDNSRMAALDKFDARIRLGAASSKFVKAVHDIERGVSFSCPPDHTTEEMYEIVRVWLQENPREQGLPAQTCVVNALKARWPKLSNGPAAQDALTRSKK